MFPSRNDALTLATAMLLLAALPARTTAQTSVDAAVLEGYQLLHAGSDGAAVQHFERLAATRPGDLAVRFGRAMAEREQIVHVAALTAPFEQRLDELIDLAERRHRQNGNDRQALFYLAQGHMLRATYRFEHDKGVWGAARDGASAKDYSERYVRLYPDDADAYLSLGLYNYFADIVPTYFKLLRFLLFVPPGDRREGLRQIERAATGGTIFRPRAEEVLVEIYASLEGRPAEALALSERRFKQYPDNDDVAFELAGLYAGPSFEQRERAASLYQTVADRRRGSRTLEGVAAHHSALFALAGVRADQWRIDEAIAIVTPIISSSVTEPDWVVPTALLRRGNYRALLDDSGAAEDTRRLQATAEWKKFHDAAAAQLSWMTSRSRHEAAMYASLIPGNRLAVEGRWDEAKRAYEALAARTPTDPQVRFRLAHLQFLRGDQERALPELIALGNAGGAVPEWLRAGALLDVARTYDLGGRRADAVRIYERIVDQYESQRPSQAARLGLITPYVRPAQPPK